MSKPRPIHTLHREIRTSPDESEPAFSYEEQRTGFLHREDEVAEDFHQRYAVHSKSRRDSGGGNSNASAGGNGTSTGGGSFWRTSEAGSTGPAFASVHMNSGKDQYTSNSARKSTGVLGAALESHDSTESVERGQSDSSHATPTAATGTALHSLWNGGPNSLHGTTPHEILRRKESSMSVCSNASWETITTSTTTKPVLAKKKKEKLVDKQRAADRRQKWDSQSAIIDASIATGPASAGGGQNGDSNSATTIMTTPKVVVVAPTNFSEMTHGSSLERSSSDQSTGSLLYGKTPHSGSLLGKSSSLLFPTGVDANAEADSEADNLKRRKINLLLDQCESVRFPFNKKKLVLNNMSLTAADLPLQYLVGTSLGNTLHKLSLTGNRLGSVPAKLVQHLPFLKHLDISQCELHQLPDKWNLPQLKRLNVSHNRLRDFPEEGILEGLPELQELNMYGNKVAEIIIPHNTTVLSKLEILNLGYNDLAYLPDDLDQLKALKTLKVMNNFLEKVPMRVCEMELKLIDVSSNPVIQPPQETCDRGICSMRRYYHCLRMEEQSKQRALEEVQKKAQKGKKTVPKKKCYGGFMKSLTKPSRKNTDDSATANSVGPVQSGAHLDDGHYVNEQGAFALKVAPMERDTSSVDLGKERSLQQRLTSESSEEVVESVAASSPVVDAYDQVTVNDTLKVIFVGMAMVGKTSMIKRLIGGEAASVPTHDQRTVGVDIYQWNPKEDVRFEHIDSRIEFQDEELSAACGDVDVKFSVWDFAGQHVYHATHELFFSSRALYVLVWDMGAMNRDTMKRKGSLLEDSETGAFKLSYDSSDDESVGDCDDDNFAVEEEARRADRALERDIDEKVQFWVDCIQSSSPGAAILPVSSFADYFAGDDCEGEAKRRCNMLKNRLLKHERRRIKGIKKRLKDYVDQNRADDPAALRLRKLLCPYTRPKLIFGNDEDSVVRVSGTQYTGFDRLTSKIIDIASGRDKGQWRYPIFHGHVGARIPRMRLEVREAVTHMRSKFMVVEWGYFINQLRDRGLTSVEDISDALHFLTNIGELSYFGGVMTTKDQVANPIKKNSDKGSENDQGEKGSMARERCDGNDSDVDDTDPDTAVLSMDDTSITAQSTADGSLSTVDDFMSSSLSQFVFLNPRWLVTAVACILRHDLDREIKETRRMTSIGQGRRLARDTSFYDAQMNCPVITAEDACLLWQTKGITKRAAERAQKYSNNMTVTPFEFLQLLLIRFGVFVPIDLSIDKAFLGGHEYAQLVDSLCGHAPTPEEVEIIVDSDEVAPKAEFFFLPSLLGSSEPAEAWTYKNTDSWKTTLCHSILFPDGVPPGLMERLTAGVLSSIYAVAHRKNVSGQDFLGNDIATYEGKLTVKEVLCWRTAFLLKLGTQVTASDGSSKESIVEIIALLADRDSHLCVGSAYMGIGMRRLIVSGRGQVGDGGRKIWKGGYLLVLKCVRRVMDQYGGLEYEKQAFCPECLAKKGVSEASSWEFNSIRSSVLNGEGNIRCQHGHRVDTPLVAGPIDVFPKAKQEAFTQPSESGLDSSVPVQDLLRAIVVVGLWDGKERKIIRAGSGFIVDRKHGLIVTASHTLMNIWGDKNTPFGENYYGLRQGKVVIGVIPREKEGGDAGNKDMAVFRYFATIVAKDPSMERGECHLDACVLRITTRMEQDVGGYGDGCGDQPERLLLNNPVAMKKEKLQALKITDKCELEEQVRILGYNQGGEGRLLPGESLNRYVDFARGYVCKRFASGEESGNKVRDLFKPRQEIVVICPTIGGHSGGPCVNQQGEVIGILSRADPAENQRCYISPTSEWVALVRMARRAL